MKSPSSPFFFRRQPVIETARLRLRELGPEDSADLFRMDSDPQVHRYLGNQPLTTIEQAAEIITAVREQYQRYGIGRWAVERRDTGEFLGWSGFKWIDEAIGTHLHFLDVGFRFSRAHWGQGHASESALACMKLARRSDELAGYPICGVVAEENTASEKVLIKLGLRHTDTFEFLGYTVHFYEQ